jgi:hypothetical protein
VARRVALEAHADVLAALALARLEVGESTAWQALPVAGSVGFGMRVDFW